MTVKNPNQVDEITIPGITADFDGVVNDVYGFAYSVDATMRVRQAIRSNRKHPFRGYYDKSKHKRRFNNARRYICNSRIGVIFPVVNL